MIITRETQEAIVSNYQKLGKSNNEVLSFIDGMEAMFDLISKKIEDDRTTKTI